MRTYSMIFALSLLLLSAKAHAFGHKAMNVTEIKGVTETQLSKAADPAKLSVLVRGKAAELMYKTLQEKREEQIGSEALEVIGNLNNTHWTVKGKQVSCSRIQNTKNKKEDYACAFEVTAAGKVAVMAEPFSPTVFNLAKTRTAAKMFQKKAATGGGRGLASAAPVLSPHPASAYVMYDDPKKKLKSEDALLVLRGKAAAQMISFLTEGKNKEFFVAGTKGVKGSEIACVGAKSSEEERCALVVSLNDGSISTWKNPLFK